MGSVTECTPWGGRTNAAGYGTIGKDLAHRRAWEEVHGPIPDGMTLDHTCHDPAACRLGVNCPHRRCVNLDHLVVCTPEENKARGGIGLPQLAKRECPKGHPYAGENLLVSGGRRMCRACRRENMQARRDTAKRRRCLEAGHEFTPQSDAEGKTYCVICRSVTAREVGVQNRRTHCPQGHEYTPENSYTFSEYVKCRQCNQKTVAARSARRREQHLEERGHAYELAQDVNSKPYCKACRLNNPGPGGRR